MVAVLVAKGLSRTRARSDWQHLNHITKGEPMTESETIHEFESQIEHLQVQQAEQGARLAKAEARIAGQGRELDALRQELALLRQGLAMFQGQQATEHAIVATIDGLRILLGKDDAAWYPLEQAFRQDGRNGAGPLMQYLRAAVSRKLAKPF
jgi:uncharacterized coiled-coil protein SlyX